MQLEQLLAIIAHGGLENGLWRQNLSVPRIIASPDQPHFICISLRPPVRVRSLISNAFSWQQIDASAKPAAHRF